MSCTPWAPPSLCTNATRGPHSWGMARSPRCSCMAQSGGHWGERIPRPGEFGSWYPSVGLRAGKEGLLTMEQNSKSGLSGHEAGLSGWPTLLRGDQIRTFGRPLSYRQIQVRERMGYGQGRSWARTVTGRDNRNRMLARPGESRAWTPR